MANTPLFKFRLSDAERLLWQEQADHCEVSLSEWIRDCCNDRLKYVESPTELPVPAPKPEPVVAPPVIAKPVVRTMAHPGNCRCMMCKISRGEKV